MRGRRPLTRGPTGGTYALVQLVGALVVDLGLEALVDHTADSGLDSSTSFGKACGTAPGVVHSGGVVVVAAADLIDLQRRPDATAVRTVTGGWTSAPTGRTTTSTSFSSGSRQVQGRHSVALHSHVAQLKSTVSAPKSPEALVPLDQSDGVLPENAASVALTVAEAPPT